jgi:alkyl sulfatase BDS1-like metallo-beta-lactamase superfamily hydrolase
MPPTRPDNQGAKNLQADILEQMGYQAESGPWRGFYLTGADELRHGVKKLATPNAASADIVASMSPELLFVTWACSWMPKRQRARRWRSTGYCLTSTRSTRWFLENSVLIDLASILNGTQRRFSQYTN